MTPSCARPNAQITPEMTYSVVPKTRAPWRRRREEGWRELLPVGQAKVIVPTRLELLQFHYITFRNKWTLFVRRHRFKILFQRKRYVCIRWTLKRDCFEHKPVLVTTDGGQAIQLKRNLMKGSIPTKDTLVIVLKNSLTALLKIPHDNT